MPKDTGRTMACIGIGSNLKDPVAQVEAAIATLAALPDTHVERASSLYRNPPMGPPDQPDYVNAVAIIRTGLDPGELLRELQSIERRQGRIRRAGERWGPRIVDLDILTFGSRVIAESGLKIPHPGIAQRNFVLFPLVEVAPELDIPGMGTARALMRRLDASALERVE